MWKIPYCKGCTIFLFFFCFFFKLSCFVCLIYFEYSLSKKIIFFAYICNIIGQTHDDTKVFAEICWDENDVILVIERRVGISLKTIKRKILTNQSPNLMDLSRVLNPRKPVSIERRLKSWNIDYDFKWNQPYLSHGLNLSRGFFKFDLRLRE